MYDYVLLSAVIVGLSSAVSAGDTVTLSTKLDGQVRVEINGELFTNYVYRGQNKPILYPIVGPHGLHLTRNYPMKTVAGEANDHRHHRSLWFTHDSVNGVGFWHEGKDAGKTVHVEFLELASGGRGVIKTLNKWVSPQGEVVCTDTRTITIQSLHGSRAIDYDITIHASEGKVTFGDTKEGTMGIRTHPNLRLKNDKRRGVTTANGQSLNSEGIRNGEMWGKRAKWVDYWGKIEGHTVGIAIFDHSGNPRHPTWWHARDYGLVAANAFGVHNFEKKPAGTGDMVIEAGDSVTFRYRFLFHEGDADTAKIAERYAEYTAK